MVGMHSRLFIYSLLLAFLSYSMFSGKKSNTKKIIYSLYKINYDSNPSPYLMKILIHILDTTLLYE